MKTSIILTAFLVQQMAMANTPVSNEVLLDQSATEFTLVLNSNQVLVRVLAKGGAFIKSVQRTCNKGPTGFCEGENFYLVTANNGSSVKAKVIYKQVGPVMIPDYAVPYPDTESVAVTK